MSTATRIEPGDMIVWHFAGVGTGYVISVNAPERIGTAHCAATHQMKMHVYEPLDTPMIRDHWWVCDETGLVTIESNDELTLFKPDGRQFSSGLRD